MHSGWDIIKHNSKCVMAALGTGHSECIYHKALITALNKMGVHHRSEVPCPIWFMNECIGMGRADIVLDNIVVEIKANKNQPKHASPQLEKYVKSLSQTERKKYQGFIVNFNQKTNQVDFWTSKKQTKESLLFKQSLEKSKCMKSPPFVQKKRNK